MAFLTSAIPTNAQKRSLEQMQDIAAQTMLSMEGDEHVVTRSADAVMEVAMSSPELAVFNGSNGGWVMVSADERTAGSVLAYSTEGSFQWASAPDNVKSWVGEYQLQIDSLDILGVEFVSADAPVVPGLGSPIVSPLIKTMWGQNSPYNKMCPMDSKGKRSVTGCLATALAQIMYYWHYDADYERGTHTNVFYPECTVDFSQSEYDWSNMRDTYSKVSYSVQEADAVSKLMYDCGVAVDMSYSSGSSGAYNEAVPQAISSFFGYSSLMQCCHRDSYSSSKWISMLTNELESKRPVLYSGHNKNSGHAFVCDGYDIGYEAREARYYFHFNWGWDGRNDGYFLLSALKPEEGHDYSGSQNAIVNIRPAFDADERPVWQNGFCFGRNPDNTFRLMAYDNNVSMSTVVTPQYVEVRGNRHSYIIPTLFMAFNDNVTRVEINGAADIKANAFWSNPNIETLYLGESIAKIRDYAFEDCSGLKEVYCLSANPPSATANAFSGATSLADMTLFVPGRYYSRYRYDKFWSKFGIIRIIDVTGVESTGDVDSDEPVFNLMGMPVNDAATPNIYIQGGRKYLR